MSNKNKISKKFVSDLGERRLLPFCPIAEAGSPSQPASALLYARDGDINQIETLQPIGSRKRPSIRARRLEGALDWYHKRQPQIINEPLYRAGEWLRNTCEAALASGYRISNMDGDRIRAPGVPDSQIERGLAHAQKFNKALDYVGGPDLDSLLVKVVCLNEPMRDFEKRMEWRAGSGVQVFRISLHRLAMYRELIPPRSTRIRQL